MTVSLAQHQIEIERNLQAWQGKPLLQQIYADFYERIITLIDSAIPGRIIEIGSGIGNLKSHLPAALSTDLFPNPWLDMVCDGYHLPFATGSASHLILFDVFHHLRAPNAFLGEARRVLGARGRVILFEPFISWFSHPIYGLCHHEPVGWRDPIDFGESLAQGSDYYAAQGNATRLFFGKESSYWLRGWEVFHSSALASMSYLLSGGFSKASLYPQTFLSVLRRCDSFFSRYPRLFGARCLVGLRSNQIA